MYTYLVGLYTYLVRSFELTVVCYLFWLLFFVVMIFLVIFGKYCNRESVNIFFPEQKYWKKSGRPLYNTWGGCKKCITKF